MTRAASLGVAAGTGAMAGKQHARASEQRSRNNVSKGSFKDVPKKAGAMVGAVMDTKNKMKEKAGAVRENIRICRCRRLMRFIPQRNRQNKVYRILSVVSCRNENTGNPVVRKASAA